MSMQFMQKHTGGHRCFAENTNELLKKRAFFVKKTVFGISQKFCLKIIDFFNEKTENNAWFMV